MRLSKLKLAGFKSFVDPTTVTTPGQLVGIVGPNGCGKSNLIDAVRWVLGESRASALRGESMQDVIFNGSTTRKPVSRASVELIFDNAEGRAAGQWSQYAEIAVKRIVDREGGSDYFINNVRVRRKDVIDLFLGTGLGPRAYAIIEQGMISRVIEARPEDVRGFLEEAAGITKYKERRRETEGRLSDARDNLARVEDIRAELGQQIERLGSQAEVARRYNELHSNLLDRQALLWTFKREQARHEAERCTAAIAKLGQQVEHGSESLRQLENQLAMAREDHARLGDLVSAAQGDVYAIAAEVTRIEGELRNLRDRRARLEQQILQLSGSEQQWQARAAELEAARALWVQRLDEAELRLAQAQENLDAAQERVAPAEQQRQQAQARLDQLRRELALAEQRGKVEATRLQAAQRSLDAHLQRRQRLEGELGQLRPDDLPDLGADEARTEELQARVVALEEALQQSQDQLSQTQGVLREAQFSEREANRQVTETRARLGALQALQDRLRDQGDMARWRQHCGLNNEVELWQSLKVEAGWELAVEAVLRERIAALGPLPGSIMQTALQQPAPMPVVLLREAGASVPAAPSFDGVALLAKVSTERAELQPHLQRWLAGVYAVDSLDAWLGGAALPAGVRLVTPAGVQLDAQELCLFAPDARTHGAVERQREISELGERLDLLEAQAESLHGKVQDGESAYQQAQERLSTTRRALADTQQQAHAAQMQLLRSQEQHTRFSQQSAKLRTELDELTPAIEADQRLIADTEREIAVHDEQGEQLQSTLEQAQMDLLEADDALRRAREQLQHATRAAQEADFAQRECQAKLDEIQRNDTLTREQIGRGESELAQLIAERDGLDEDSLQLALRTALDLRQSREATLVQRREAHEALGQRIRSMDEERLRTEHAQHPLRDQLAEARLAHQAAELAHQQAIERLAELPGEPRQFSPEDLAQVRETALTREVSRINREIEELGPVNLAALNELTAASERKHFLDTQFDDLMRAIDTLEDAIRRIDRETREQLMATYNVVNKHFGELFPRLFGGGEAALVLTGEEILDAGVQIVARPPGKKNSSIHLLSGGEKALTAIALVFAMFQLNPAPFCMLDEVDAPLDDANTVRYCDMVKAMSSVTQFVFISHSKITMEMGQQLVGVTMQEQGVSRVVEVDIDEAMRMAQTTAATADVA